MSPNERTKYFRDLWPAACSAKGWHRADEARRRAVILECMQAVRGPTVTTSSPQFGRDEVTALFCYLEFLAHPADLDRSARWIDCQKDYRAYNRARQADWHERQMYGSRGSKKLQRDRFAGQRRAQGDPLDEFDPEEIRKRHLTMASRHQRAQRKARAAAAGRDLASRAPADAIGLTMDPALAAIPMPSSTPRAKGDIDSVIDPDPEYIAPKDQPF